MFFGYFFFSNILYIYESSDLGHCFGLDIGGTLAKVVYFEKTADNVSSKNGTNTTSARPRSFSHEYAANEMTQFVTQNEKFGKSGVRDVRLRVHSKSLQGVSSRNQFLSMGIFCLNLLLFVVYIHSTFILLILRLKIQN